MRNKILCVGHTTLDTFFIVKNVDVHCKLDKDLCQVCFDFGAKIPVDEIHYGIGGGAANVAVGLSKLELASSIFTVVGEDPKGLDVKDDFTKHGVDTKYLFSDDHVTDQATIISYNEDRTIFTHNTAREYSLRNVEENFQYLFLSSVGEDVADLYDEIIDLKKKRDLTLFYNPGSKELAFSHNAIQKLLPSIDYLIANINEGCAILNTALKREQMEVWDLMTILMDKGVKNVVLTDGANGAYFQSESDSFQVPVVEVEVVERTGAGDAFAAGFIASIIYGASPNDSFLWGAVNSAEVVKSFGAQKGLLTKEQLEERVKKQQKLRSI